MAGLLPLRERRAIMRRIPWVRFRREATACQGFTAGMPLKSRFHPDPEVRVASLAKHACKMPAHWRFRALRRAKMPVLDGDYCWRHIVRDGIYSSMEEEARTNRWMRRHYPELFDRPRA